MAVLCCYCLRCGCFRFHVRRASRRERRRERERLISTNPVTNYYSPIPTANVAGARLSYDVWGGSDADVVPVAVRISRSTAPCCILSLSCYTYFSFPKCNLHLTSLKCLVLLCASLLCNRAPMALLLQHSQRKLKMYKFISMELLHLSQFLQRQVL